MRGEIGAVRACQTHLRDLDLYHRPRHDGAEHGPRRGEPGDGHGAAEGEACGSDARASLRRAGCTGGRFSPCGGPAMIIFLLSFTASSSGMGSPTCARHFRPCIRPSVAFLGKSHTMRLDLSGPLFRKRLAFSSQAL